MPETLLPRQVEDARQLLRWLCQAFCAEVAGHAALNSAPWGVVLQELQALVDATMDHEGDVNARIEALVFMVIGHLDYWAQLPGLLATAIPRDLMSELKFTDVQEQMFCAEARPIAKAQIAKGRRLSTEECRQITMANYYFIGQFMCDMNMPL